MTTKELNRHLIKRISRAEYTIGMRDEEISELKEKLTGFEQLLELNQKVLLWALNRIATEEPDTKTKTVVLLDTELDEVCKRIKSSAERNGDEIIITLTE